MKILINETEAAAAQQLKDIIATFDYDVEILRMSGQMGSLLSGLNIPAPPQRYLVRSGTRLISLPVSDIAYFYVRDRMSCIRTNNNTDHLLEKSLDDICAELDARDFFRLNRQCIAHYGSIVKVQAWFNGKLKVQVKPALEEDIIVSRLRAPEFRKWLGE
ncbi:LytR/AlgR family response regulator transcription factor [Chitinophaga barathri]|uniref:LytTR family transcriptional regulator n=1 Tax=Chitinophaga barathri TaxID=1647451 RepID=A0A3N4MCJ2_9BACT|nr:LytTR family DNA-binding domain-containing protein [Chitinophaga barathri]RPD39227.1 LytTR family transcriptional regulator [Chitinophaga barathri]